ncbi:hypothetical protein [Paenibacillus paridis]|uniref:hypothetical protein n=1 Tax=Paenibacillus paridis TaxID=2583376 RepID=UPI00111DC8AB|nr:hypothetical protein [Paenibacillus paridis]
MKRRQRKKQHLKHLADIVYEVSVSSMWRARLFQTHLGKKIIIDITSVDGLNDYFEKQLRRKNLKYFVSVVSHSETRGWEDLDSSLIYFKFEAVEFLNLASYSANNPLVY